MTRLVALWELQRLPPEGDCGTVLGKKIPAAAISEVMGRTRQPLQSDTTMCRRPRLRQFFTLVTVSNRRPRRTEPPPTHSFVRYRTPDTHHTRILFRNEAQNTSRLIRPQRPLPKNPPPSKPSNTPLPPWSLSRPRVPALPQRNTPPPTISESLNSSLRGSVYPERQPRRSRPQR